MEKLRDEINRAIKEIKELNKKGRCNQVANNAGCCYSDYVSGTEKEIKEILNYLKENKDVKKIILKNLKENKNCFFHDKINRKCLIEKVKPLSCRFVSYKIYEHGDIYKYCSPNSCCKENCSTILQSEKKDVYQYKDKIYYIILNNEKIYYLNSKKIKGYKEYIEEKKTKLSSILEEI